MNRGGVGARALNLELQAAMNPAGDRKVERFGWTFAPGDTIQPDLLPGAILVLMLPRPSRRTASVPRLATSRSHP
jgi:hypothetical protein